MDEVFVIAHSASNASDSVGWEIIPSDLDLMHHGRKDQKWGVRNGPPYPLQMAKTAYKAAQKAAAATGRGAVKVAKGTAKAVKATTKKSIEVAKGTAKAVKATTKKSIEVAKKAKIKKEERDAKTAQKKKQKAISNNSYEELWNIKDKLSYKDLSDAISRIELEQKIYSRAFPPKPTFSDKMYKLSKKLGDVNNWYNTAKKTWNNFAELYNSTADGQNHPLRTIGGKGGGKDKKKDNEGNNNNGGGKDKNKDKDKDARVINIANSTVTFTGETKKDNGNRSNQNQSQNQNQNQNQNSNGLPGPKKNKKKKKR